MLEQLGMMVAEAIGLLLFLVVFFGAGLVIFALIAAAWENKS